jgi:small subunit ribosomal protein S15
MPLTTDQKKQLMDSYHRHDGDTGSPEVQIALLTARIHQLTEHLKAHKHDESSRRGLLMLVGQRRRHLLYLSHANPNAYNALTERLGLRRK